MTQPPPCGLLAYPAPVRTCTAAGSGRLAPSARSVVKKRVYIELTIPSYLAARPSRDLIKAARQHVTAEWWKKRRQEFDLYTSEVVLGEVAAGDQTVAAKRLALLADLPLVNFVPEVEEIAAALIDEGPLPQTAAADAFHHALAAVSEMDILLTWNYRHLANGRIAAEVADLLRKMGYRPPVVCTPEFLMGEE